MVSLPSTGPTQAEVQSAQARQEAMRPLVEKEIRQFERGLLTVADLITGLVEIDAQTA